MKKSKKEGFAKNGDHEPKTRPGQSKKKRFAWITSRPHEKKEGSPGAKNKERHLCSPFSKVRQAGKKASLLCKEATTRLSGRRGGKEETPTWRPIVNERKDFRRGGGEGGIGPHLLSSLSSLNEKTK